MKEFSLKRHKIAQISSAQIKSKIATPNISNPWIQFLETQIWATGWGERGQLKKTTGGFPDPPPRVNRHANIRTLLKLQGSYSGGGGTIHSDFCAESPTRMQEGYYLGGICLGGNIWGSLPGRTTTNPLKTGEKPLVRNICQLL